ncbi:hypothetical protein AWB70_01082 [Caballeronia cordobensis]|uniref:DUF4145 domain-containing protein n=1 Tax=Caballeronia cordobensis TaxID=1353886 RepID=A0A158FMA6_CABCO|nr:hypothetical protein [Caballeronia cordobensis]SAL20968.1 hypothetical protein AWB70_01082 [Caballeronia cordobensis]
MSNEHRLTIGDFLTDVPPGDAREVSIEGAMKASNGNVLLQPKDLFLNCETCDGNRYFDHDGKWLQFPGDKGESLSLFWTYHCKNCEQDSKTFALVLTYPEGSNATVRTAMKFGEAPPFGAPLPKRLLSLAGGERDYLLKGRRCENQGLGIASFAYYRRVIDAQKNKLFDQIIRVCKETQNVPDLVAELEAAKSERQFTSAVDKVKTALPDNLRIRGHNPLTLIYDALSEGLHADTDEGCLEDAKTIRVILAELTERISQALKDDASVNDAIQRLLAKKQDRERKDNVNS